MNKLSKSGQSILLVIIIVLVASVLLFGLRLVHNSMEQGARVVEKTVDADNVIYNYEYFKQAFRDIQAMDPKMATAQAQIDQFTETAGPRANWDRDDKEEAARLNTNLTGLKNVRNDMVATYNARASMVNRSIFMGKDVPSSIEQ